MPFEMKSLRKLFIKNTSRKIVSEYSSCYGIRGPLTGPLHYSGQIPDQKIAPPVAPAAPLDALARLTFFTTLAPDRSAEDSKQIPSAVAITVVGAR